MPFLRIQYSQCLRPTDMKSLLEQGKIAVDIELASQLEETKTRTLSKGLSWASQTVVLHAIATSVLTAVLFLGMPRWPGIFGSPTAEASSPCRSRSSTGCPSAACSRLEQGGVMTLLLRPRDLGRTITYNDTR